MLTFEDDNFVHNYVGDLLDERIVKLKEDYERNPYIDEAIIVRNGEDISIELNITLEVDDRQDIVQVFEKGGSIISDGEITKILPGNYIERNLLSG